jgi:NAD(P)-dependent dehydrogenase (short-subunit alcohol dehydrogenase family)
MRIKLDNNVVFLTGATSGLGEAILHYLSQAGATVAIHFNRNRRKAEALQDKIGNNSQIFQADLNNTDEIVRLFEEVIGAYGRIDTIVNNAGVYLCSPIGDRDTDWLDVWDRTLKINLTSAGLLCKLSIQHFIKHGGGRIINIASRAAFRGDSADYFAYAASKGGLVALTRTIARAYGKDNIKAFIIAPGFFRTPMAEEYIKQHGEESIIKELSLKKLTEPDDVAPSVVFLASGMMDHATGCTIDINAGSYVR